MPIAFISVLHPPSAYGLNSSSADHSNVRVLDLTDDVEVFYADDADEKGSLGRVETWIEESSKLSFVQARANGFCLQVFIIEMR